LPFAHGQSVYLMAETCNRIARLNVE